jgi:hypothetical protein
MIDNLEGGYEIVEAALFISDCRRGSADKSGLSSRLSGAIKQAHRLSGRRRL